MSRLPGAVYSTHGNLLLSLGQHTDPESYDVSSRTTENARDDESCDDTACHGSDCINESTGTDSLCDSCRQDEFVISRSCLITLLSARLAALTARPRKCITVQGVTVSEVA